LTSESSFSSILNGLLPACRGDREETDRRESLIAAGQNRMRPITMTTLAAILTLLPLAFALGQGSEMQQPLAIAIISGLIVQLPLVLGVMPVLFNLTQRREKKG
jgi:multidrug efflux pump subunit AcrB